MVKFLELVDGEDNIFIVPVASLGAAYTDEETGCLVVVIDENPTKLLTTYEEYRAMVL